MDSSQLPSALAGNIHALAIAERDYKKAQAEADKWESLYQRTLKVGTDESALNEIQFHKEVLTKKASNLKAILDQQKEKVANLRSNFNGPSNTLNNTHYQLKAATPHDILNELMLARDLKQKDLIEVFGSKGITSEVVNGKRSISKNQAKALGEFFHISPALFL